MGKSTAARFLRARGVPVVDTDELARQLVEPGQPALAEIQQEFGKSLVASDGRLRRDKLACIVFADAGARETLEKILHPKIRARWRAQVEIWRGGDCRLAVVVIPLLFETRAESEFTKLVCVACSAANQHRRLLERGWSPQQIQQRIAAQMPVEQKIARADFIVWTDGDLDAHEEQLGRIFLRI
jgi:dephospho-CoA kinase